MRKDSKHKAIWSKHKGERPTYQTKLGPSTHRHGLGPTCNRHIKWLIDPSTAPPTLSYHVSSLGALHTSIACES
jgi:hypothetical protein